MNAQETIFYIAALKKYTESQPSGECHKPILGGSN